MVGSRGWLRGRVVACVALFAVLMSGVSVGAYATETEPNDSMATASRIESWGVVFDEAQSELAAGGDVDWFRYDADSAGVWTVQVLDVSTGLAAGVDLTAYDAAGREVGRLVAGSHNVLASAEVAMAAPGRMFFRLSATNGEQSGTYTIQVWPQYGNGLSWGRSGEPNGSPYLSQPMPIGQRWSPGLAERSAATLWRPDVDMYHLVGGSRAETYAARFISRHTPLRVTVLDDTEKPTQSVTCGVWVVCTLSVDVPAGETVYVSVTTDASDGAGAYGACVVPAQGSQWCAAAPVQRIAGADRYETSAALMDSETPVNLFIASGEVFGDALSGAAAAVAERGPVLLVRKDSIPPSIAAELERLTTYRIVILGGPNTISPAVEKQLRSYDARIVERWDGVDRYATSAEISRNVFRAGVGTAYVASGEVFPDGLAVGPTPESGEGPVLLVRQKSIPAPIVEELTRLKPKRIVVVGGSSTIDPALVSALARYTTGSVERWAGDDRYATASAVSAHQFPADAQHVVITSGEVYADALSGAPAARFRGAPILLVTRDRIPAATAAELRRIKPYWITILGGTNSVSDAVRAELDSYAAP